MARKNSKPAANAPNTPPAKENANASSAATDTSTPPKEANTPNGSPAAADAPPPEKAQTWLISGPAQGRRRAGMAFGPEPVEVAVDALSKDARAALQSDPLLTIKEG